MAHDTTDSDGPVCDCGHRQNAHEHYRRGSDCALCDAGSCIRFRASVNQPEARIIDASAAKNS